jgi:triosephosphate isomerase
MKDAILKIYLILSSTNLTFSIISSKKHQKMRQKIVAGNWKMNLTIAEGINLINDVTKASKALQPHQQIIFCTPSLHLSSSILALPPNTNFYVGAQNCHTQKSGAFTGEISAAMLANAGITHVLVGHSERREYNHETNEMLAQKVTISLENNLTPIFCCGEPLQIREQGAQNDYVANQIKESLYHLTTPDFNKIIVAYEPIWAIGTGLTASSEQAQAMHAHIRATLVGHFGQSASNTTILYGGSCKPSNAAELFACPDVDGGLIGGASLVASDFVGIINCLP